MKLLLAFIVLTIIFFIFMNNGQRKNSEPKSLIDRPLKKPQSWDTWQSLLEQNSLPSLKISLINEKPTTPWQSKFGGIPYWPKSMPYPEGKNGKPLYLLAQINFSEIPEPLPNFPTEGLLQFFISPDDLWGMEFIDKKNPLDQYLSKPKNFKVVFHKAVTTNPEDLATPTTTSLTNDSLPLSGSALIKFERKEDIASPMDYRFNTITAPLGEADDEITDYAFESLEEIPAHKLGGYASFTQDDPRPYSANNQDWILLFQMDTDSNDHVDIMWGDAGIANFFIRPEDLKNLDFSKVWYNWDCH